MLDEQRKLTRAGHALCKYISLSLKEVLYIFHFRIVKFGNTVLNILGKLGDN